MKRDNQYSIRIPKYIIEKVDEEAAKFEKKRAGMLQKIIIDHYEGEKK